MKDKTSKILKRKEELEKVIQDLSQKYINKLNKLEQAQDGAQQTQNDSNVEDAEFKEVNDDEDKNNC